MARNLFGCLILILCTLRCSLPASSARQRGIQIGIIGDQTLSADIQASYTILEKGVSELSRQNVDVVLHTGDLLESSGSPADIRALFTQATGILDKLPVPWFLTAGDHDVNPPPPFQPDSPDRSREQLFQELYGARVPAVRTHPYYSFDIGPYHFIALYAHQVLDADPRWGNIFLAQIDNDQFTFLEQDLRDHRNQRGIIVFVHQPLWYHVSGWRRVHELLRRYPVIAVISGHYHYNQDDGTTDGIRYLTVGATGGTTKVGSRNAGNVQHVTVLKVSGSRITDVKLISLSDNQPLALTPRVDMDRAQAVNSPLEDFFYTFPPANPVFLKSGQLVSSCSTGQPAAITLPQVGNPIDVPLDVKITLDTTPQGLVTLSSSAFTAGQCQRVINDTECILARTARTFVSNYSSVNLDMSKPLWTTGLAPAGSGPQPGTLLNFNIRATFDGASGRLFVEKTAPIVVQACPP